jgi:hypothetical protein
MKASHPTVAGVVVFSLTALACSSLRPVATPDMEIYRAVIRQLARDAQVTGLQVSPWLNTLPSNGCDDPDFPAFVQQLGSPSASHLAAAFCAETIRRALSPGQARDLNSLIPPALPGIDRELRRLELSPVAYDPTRTLALVFVQRQLHTSYAVGEFFLLRLHEDQWRVAAHQLRWIS